MNDSVEPFVATLVWERNRKWVNFKKQPIATVHVHMYIARMERFLRRGDRGSLTFCVVSFTCIFTAQCNHSVPSHSSSSAATLFSSFPSFSSPLLQGLQHVAHVPLPRYQSTPWTPVQNPPTRLKFPSPKP